MYDEQDETGTKKRKRRRRRERQHTLFDQVLFVVDNADILLCKVLNCLVSNLPKLFCNLRNKT
jgi:hypothetical protein